MGYLRRYAEVTDIDLCNSCDYFIAGVTAYMAAHSWMSAREASGNPIPGQCEILDIAALPNRECWDRAWFFAGGLVAKDPYYGRVFSLAVTLAGVFRRVWPDEPDDDWIGGDWAAELGWYMAAEADGSGAIWTDDNEPHGLSVPAMSCACTEWFVNEEEEP